MKTEDLTAKGLTEEQVTFVMAEHGKDIKREQDKTKAAEDARGALQGQLTTATDALKAFEGIDPANIKVELEKAQTALKDAESEHAAELARRDSRAETEKLLSGHAFINDITRDFYVGEIEKALDDNANKGKSRQDIFDALTKGEDGNPKSDIFAENTQPKFAGASPAGTVTKPPAGGGDYAQRLAEARKNKDNVAAIAIKNEAAAEGVILI
jgi:Phage minor structural protein GP20.